MLKLHLQMFAEAGSLVNTTGANLVNAGTGATTAYGTTDLTPGMKTYYETMMLDNARDNLVYTQLGDNEPLPAHKGKVVEWRKWNTLPDADELTEGVIPEGKKFGQTSQNVTVASQGLYVAISDDLDTFHVDPVALGATEEVGASLGRSLEKMVRAALQHNGNVLYADALNTSAGGGHAYVSSPATRTALSAAAATLCALSPDMIAQAVTLLQKTNAPYYDGAEYLGVLHPSVWYDLRRNPEWIDVHKYEASREIFNGEVGELHGVRFLKSTMAPVIKGTPMSAGAHTLTVKTAIAASATEIEVKEVLTAADINALKGKKVRIGTTEYTLHADGGTAGVAGAAKLKLASAITSLAANLTIYFSDNAIDGAAVYQTYIFGKDAFKVIKPDDRSIEMIIHDRKSGVGGPLNQFGTIGGRFTSAAKVVYPERMVCIESTSKYSFKDTSN